MIARIIFLSLCLQGLAAAAELPKVAAAAELPKVAAAADLPGVAASAAIKEVPEAADVPEVAPTTDVKEVAPTTDVKEVAAAAEVAPAADLPEVEASPQEAEKALEVVEVKETEQTLETAETKATAAVETAALPNEENHSSFLLGILQGRRPPTLLAKPTNLLTERDPHLDFYVVTAIFNPASYQSRYALYHDFARHIEESGAQLITIEAIFPTLGQHEFKVTEKNNPLHIQLTSDSVYWVKEDLINIAVSKLPENARWIAWLDADIYFHSPAWIAETISALERHTVVQMFKYAHFLNQENEILRTDYSFGYSLVHGKPLLGFGENDWYPHPGYGWAMSVEDFKKVGGLPAYDIVGGGDLYFAYTLVNHMSDVIEKDFDEDYKQKMREESEKTYRLLGDISAQASKTIAGFVPVSISHRWHGARKDRGYVDRLNILIAHDFNYFTDVSREGNGLLRFANDTDSLQQDVRCYFENRNEDNTKVERSQCHSNDYNLYIKSLVQSPSANAHSICNCGAPPKVGEPGHYYGKTYTYYTTQNYHNVLDVKALESIVRLIKK